MVSDYDRDSFVQKVDAGEYYSFYVETDKHKDLSAELSKASRASLKILQERGVAARTACFVNMIPETSEAEQAFLEWLRENEERNLDAIIAAAKRATEQYSPKEE